MEQQQWIEWITTYGIYVVLGIVLYKLLKSLARKFKEEEARKGMTRTQAKLQQLSARERKRKLVRSPMEWHNAPDPDGDLDPERAEEDESLGLDELQKILQSETDPARPAKQARKGVADFIPATVLQQVMLRDEGRCKLCGSDKEINWHFIVPPAKGGSPTEENVRLLCESCQASQEKE